MEQAYTKPSEAKLFDGLKLRPLVATLLAIFPVFNAQFSFAAAPPPQPSAITSAPASDISPLPDLGKPAETSNGKLNVNAGPGGISVEGRFDRQKIIIAPEYSNQTGFSLGAVFASLLGDNGAVGILVNQGGDKQEWLINAGYQLDPRQRLIFTGGQLTQKLDYSFLSGKEKVGMTQNTGGLSYQLQLGEALVRSIDLSAYISKTDSKDLTDKRFAVDTANLYELWNDPRRIAGGTVTGLQGRLGISPISGSLVKLSLGAEELKYDVLIGKDNTTRVTSGIEWLQQLPDRYNLKVSADAFASQNRYTIGLDRTLPGANGCHHTLGIAYTGVQGREGLGNDSQFKLIYSYSFGNGSGGSSRAASPLNASLHGTANPMAGAPDMAAGDPATDANSGLGKNLLDQVAMRPNYIPSHVVAKVDKTALPTRLVAVDKTGQPAGSTIDAATGDITTPLGVSVTGIAGVTRNGAAFANGHQFALSGNNLITRPSQIVQPAAGATDIYVVTINNAGGGTTLATIVVSKGSVKVDSIVISTPVTTPDAFTFVDQTDVALSTVIESATITVSGINAAVAISVTGGEYRINGGAWTSSAGTVTNGQTVKLRHTSSASNNTVTNTVLTIGGVSDTFTTTTVAALPPGYISQGGLTWMPITVIDNWTNANTYCTTTTINGQTGWRLPTTAELTSLSGSGAMNGLGLGWIWSSTPNGAGRHENVILSPLLIGWDPDTTSASLVSCVR